MIRPVSICLLMPILALTGCMSGGSTSHSWACRATGRDGCASIAEIDRPDTVPRPDGPGPIFGARVAPWWEDGKPTSVTRAPAPRREGDQTMRIVLAPYIDGQGDYHDRSEVYAVMRRAQWWIAPPIEIAASPKEGAELPPAPEDGHGAN